MRPNMPTPYRPKGYATYYVRKAVPARLRASVGRRELKRSLQTSDPAEAKRRAPAVVSELQRIIDQTDQGYAFSYSDVRSLAALYRKERRQELLNIAARDGWDCAQFDGAGLQAEQPIDDEQAIDGNPDDAAVAWGMARLPAFTAKHGAAVPKDWQAALARDLYLAERHALQDVRAERIGDERPARAYDADPVVRPRSMLELFKDYAKSRDLSPKTVSDWRRCVRVFDTWLDGRPPYDLASSDIYQYADDLLSGKATGRAMSSRSVNTVYLAAIARTFTYAVQRGRLASNPAQGVKLQATRAERAQDTPRAYTDDEVAVLLAAARRQDSAVKRWVPWLLAFTGARISEVLHARKADVRTEHGITYLAIAPEPGRFLKTAESRRRVPLHDALKAEGFMDYVASLSASDYLFPGDWSDKQGDRSKTPGNAVRAMLRQAMPEHTGKVSPAHSFRHWLAASLRRYSVSDDVARELAGHAVRDAHAGYGRDDLATLNDAITRLKSPL